MHHVMLSLMLCPCSLWVLLLVYSALMSEYFAWLTSYNITVRDPVLMMISDFLFCFSIYQEFQKKKKRSTLPYINIIALFWSGLPQWRLCVNMGGSWRTSTLMMSLWMTAFSLWCITLLVIWGTLMCYSNHPYSEFSCVFGRKDLSSAV